jgi:hypothetical protein
MTYVPVLVLVLLSALAVIRGDYFIDDASSIIRYTFSSDGMSAFWTPRMIPTSLAETVLRSS